MAEVKVIHPGLISTVQDGGRRGFMKYGVPICGAMDNYAFRTANLLLHNPENAAVLEITLMGPKFEFSHNTFIAITGADFSPKINSEPASNNKVHKVYQGDILEFGTRKYGCRGYIAIAGGFHTEKVMSSRSWYEGITENFRLNKGMEIPFDPPTETYESVHSAIKPNLDYMESHSLPSFPGPEFSHLGAGEVQDLFSREFTIDKNNSRMAIQLKENFNNSLEQIITSPVLPGTVQLTPSGKLIVLMRDCQTTGGYPRILQLSEAGLNMIAQKTMGDKISFSKQV